MMKKVRWIYKALTCPKKYEMHVMKGLGEMDAEELNETTMDIENRSIK